MDKLEMFFFNGHGESIHNQLEKINLELIKINKSLAVFHGKPIEILKKLILENKIAGYYVKGIKDNNGIEYPKRVFDKKTNRWNLDEANKFIDILNYINKNNVDMFRFDIEEIDVNSIECSFYEQYYLGLNHLDNYNYMY